MTDLERVELAIHQTLAGMNSATDVQTAFEIFLSKIKAINIELAKDSK